MGVFLLLLLVNAAVGSATVAERDRLLAETERWERARDAAADLQSSYVDQDMGARTYVIAHDRAFLEPYNDGVAAARELLATLRALLADEPDALTVLADVERAAARWREEAAEPIIVATVARRHDEAAALVATGETGKLFGEVRTGVRAVRDLVDDRLEALTREVDGARQRITGVLYATFAAGLALVVATALLVRRWITRPLRLITEAATGVAAGDLERQIPAVGPSDVAALGRAAELMRRRILAELETSRRAEQALRSEGAVVSALRRELAPSAVPLPPGVESAAALIPAVGVLAGDWYDVVAAEDGSVTLCLMDVSGHGQTTGVFALHAKNLILAALRQGLTPGAALTWVAATLGDTEDMFLTAVLANVSGGRCRYANAGHPPVLVVGNGPRWLEPTGPLLGPLEAVWDDAEVELAADEVLLAYTDGVLEARDAHGEEFGEERLAALAESAAVEGPDAVVSRCLDAVNGWAAGDVDDDLTMVALSAPGRVSAPDG